MHRLTTRIGDERGASAVLVGILLTVLVGFTAIAVDVGAMYSERAQLQNAADAGALAAAQYCGAHEDCVPASAKAGAGSAALFVTGGNMVDGETTTAMGDPVPPTATSPGMVMVRTKTPAMPHPLAAALGFASSDVGASATAKWEDDPNSATVVPFAIGECALPTSGDGTRKWYDIDYDNSCGGSVPGGFGWLSDGTPSCLKDIELLEFTTITTGEGGACELTDAELSEAAEQLGCTISPAAKGNIEKLFLCFVGHTVLVPVFGPPSACAGPVPGGKAYCITKFAAFEMVGLHVEITNTLTPPGPGGADVKIDDCLADVTPACVDPIGKKSEWGHQGFEGRFIKYVTAEDDWLLGPRHVRVRLIE